MSSDNDRNADNQQESNLESISDEYFTGFAEGEGCFYVGFSKRPDLPLGWQIITEFQLSQNPGGRLVLEAFRDRLRCGYLKPNHAKNPRDKTWVLIVRNRSDLRTKLIPFFLKNRLHTSKKEDFGLFIQVLNVIESQEHLTADGFRNLVDLVYASPRSKRKRYSKDLILRSSETIRRNP